MTAAILVAARLLLAAVLLAAGAAKLGDRPGSRRTLLDFGVPPLLTPTLAWLIPLAELACGAALLPSATARLGAAGALCLLTLFLAAIGWNLVRGRQPDCRCFGQLHSAPIGWTMVARNLALAAAAVAIVLGSEPPPVFGWVATLTVGEAVALGVGLLALATAAAEGWLLSNLLAQNGRLLQRIDRLEGGLAGGATPVRADPDPSPAEAGEGLPLGTPAPAFVLSDLSGQAVSLEDLLARGRQVLLAFVDPGCGPCTALLPDLARWRSQHGETVTLVLISSGTVEANMAKVNGYDVGPVLLQGGEDIGGRYRTSVTPSAVVVDTRGLIASDLAMGAEAIRQLVRSATHGGQLRRQRPRAPGAVVTGVVALLAVVGLLMAARPRLASPGVAPHAWVLQVEGEHGWETWWRGDSAPRVWEQPNRALMEAVVWRQLAPGAELGEVVISSGSLALRTRLVLGRFDPALHGMRLVGPGRGWRSGTGWTIDSADERALLAFNAGQFGEHGPWGWLVRDGRERQAPGWGPLSQVVAVSRSGIPRLLTTDSLPALGELPETQEAFQSYPSLLVGGGEVPDLLRTPSGLVNLGRRDSRLALCVLTDGRVLVALTRFDNLGRVFGRLPIGLTLGEMSAVMGALGCRRALSLDGGLSAQLLARSSGRASWRWEGVRSVPLGIEVRPRR